ncbi:MAG TPA: LytTR family DNA-binding domain-containing protein [Candidatus Elarobacter sp.]|jgi:two-component system LytT family response regulator
MIRVVVADDEAPARRKLVRFIRESDGLELAGEAATGREALDVIAATAPDVVFLDVRMPDLDGLAVAAALGAAVRPPRVVFVTAFDEHAVRAFELNALDYLLKPYDRERFDRTLARARDDFALRRDGAGAAQIADLIARLRGGERYAKRLLITEGDRSFYLPVAEIVRLEADGNDVAVHGRRGRFTIRATLESLDARLDPAQFARVHRSHVVNIDEIAEVRAWFHGDQRLVLRDGAEIPWSRRYAAKRPDLQR